MIKDHVARSFARQSMMTTLGAGLIHAADGACEIHAPLLPGSCQQHGYAHAGLSFAIGDSAAGYAALSTLPDGHEVLTSEMKIHLLAPGRGPLLKARGTVIRAGRRLIVVKSDVYSCDSGSEIHIAMLTGTIVPVTG